MTNNERIEEALSLVDKVINGFVTPRTAEIYPEEVDKLYKTVTNLTDLVSSDLDTEENTG